MAQSLVAADHDLVGTGADQMFQVLKRALGAHAGQCHQTATASIGKLAPLTHEFVGHRSHDIVIVGLNEYPYVSIRIEVNRAGGLVALDRNGIDGAGVDAPAAQDTAVGHMGAAVGALALHHNATRGTGANAAATANARLAIDYQSAHLCHPLDNLGNLCRLLDRRALDGLARLVAVGHK